MIDDFNQAKKIHEENFNRYKLEKDKHLEKECRESFDKSAKIVFSILQDITNETKARAIFNDYCKHIDKKCKNADAAILCCNESLAIKDNHILRLQENLKTTKTLLLWALILEITTLIISIIF